MSRERPSLGVLAAVVCAVSIGCRGGSPPPVPAARPPSADEQVLLTLDCYNPMYKVDEDGRVTHLNLSWRHLPATALTDIDKLTELHAIDLAYSTVTDDGLAQLKDLQKLHDMGLAGTPVTDRGLAYLEKLQSLRYVWVPKETVTEAAVQKLKEARPDLNVYLQ